MSSIVSCAAPNSGLHCSDQDSMDTSDNLDDLFPIGGTKPHNPFAVPVDKQPSAHTDKTKPAGDTEDVDAELMAGKK